MKKRMLVLSVLILAQTGASSANAQWGTIVREGWEAVMKGSVKSARKGLQEGIEQAMPQATRMVPAGLQEATETAAKSATKRSLRVVGRESLESIAQHSGEVCRSLTSRFGQRGVQALSSLSRESGEKLAQLAPELQRHPLASEWLATIAKHGDRAVAWLWKRKASLAVGTAATAVLLRPSDFLEASEQVAREVIQTTGQHMVQPLIEQTARHVAQPLVRDVAVPAARHLLPSLCLTVGTVASLSGLGWYVWRRRQHHT